jgi:hypothetical protein
MAQSALTVTPPNPTPPTNFSFLGTTPPTAPAQLAVDDGAAGPLTAFAAKLASVDNANFPSLDAEGRGTEVVVTQTYSPSTFLPAGPLVTVSDLGSYTTTPNAQHASSLSPAVNPTATSLGTPSTTSGGGNTTQTVIGTGFTKQSVVFVNGAPVPTNVMTPSLLSCPTVTKRPTAGTWPVTVVTGGSVVTAPLTWTFT